MKWAISPGLAVCIILMTTWRRSTTTSCPILCFGLGSIPWGVDLFAPTPILELDTNYKQTTESWAVFGHGEWQFTERWRLTLGARYTEEDRAWKGCTFVADDGSLGNFLNAQFGSTLGPGDCGTIDDDPSSPTYIFGLLGSMSMMLSMSLKTLSTPKNGWARLAWITSSAMTYCCMAWSPGASSPALQRRQLQHHAATHTLR